MDYQNIVSSLKRQQQRRERLQEMLNSTVSPYQNEVVSNRVVPYSPVQGFSKLAQAIIARKGMDEVDAREKELNAELEAGRQDAFAKVLEKWNGMPESQYQLSESETFDGEQIQGLRNAEVPADKVGAAMMAMQDPYLKDTGLGKALMPSQSRGAYSSVQQMWNPETQTMENVIVDTRGVPGQNIYKMDGTPYEGPLLGKNTPEAEMATSRGAEAGKGEAKLGYEPMLEFRKKYQGELGTAQAQAFLDLPATEQKAAETLRLVDELVNHPGFEDAVGFWDNPVVLGGLVPWTDAAGFKKRLDQLTGRTFLEIFPTLKGGGQITEIEGQKGQDAINRMSRATTEDEFRAAAADFKNEIEKLRGIVRNKAGGAQAVSPDVEVVDW